MSMSWTVMLQQMAMFEQLKQTMDIADSKGNLNN